MRRFLLSLLIIGYAGQASAQTCAQPAEAEALATMALKSELMVGAISCNRDQQYDRFMRLFLPYIQEQQHVMDGYFERGFGLSGQMAEDEFVTAVANGLAEASAAKGSNYCAENSELFLQVLNLGDSDALVKFIAANPQPTVAAPLCPAASPALTAPSTPEAQSELVQAEPLAPLPGVTTPRHARWARVHHKQPMVIVRRKAPEDSHFALVSI